MCINTRHTFPHRYLTFAVRPISIALLVWSTADQAWAEPSTPTLVPAQKTAGKAIRFNSRFLVGGADSVDLSRLSAGDTVLPGDYLSDLYVNKTWRGRFTIKFRAQPSSPNEVLPCIDQDLLESMNVDLKKLSSQATALLQTKQADRCIVLPDLIPDASTHFDNGQLRLDVSIPQIALQNIPSDYINPKDWDDGVTSAILQYNANVNRSQMDAGKITSSYLNYTAGLNIGAWRLRQINVISQNQTQGQGLQSQDTVANTQRYTMQTYARRSLASIKSQLTLGDANTDNTIFDGFNLRGVQLASDDRMYPDSQRGFAPVIRGVARSNARVQIRQNGALIREIIVAPGPFEIGDLPNSGSSGDLQATVIEADGSQKTMALPYTYVDHILRPAQFRYSFAAGKYRDDNSTTGSKVLQLTGQYGFSNLFTGYGGIIAADGYSAGAIGTALNTDLGAFSVDVTHTRTHISPQSGYRGALDFNGQQLRLAYAKFLSSINTSVTFSGAHATSTGYINLIDAMNLREPNAQSLITPGIGSNTLWAGRQKNTLTLNINHQFANSRNSITFLGSTRDYWDHSGRDTQYQASYNTAYNWASFGVSLARYRDNLSNRWSNSMTLSMTVPLGRASNAPLSTTSLQHDSQDGSNSVNEVITGTFGANNNMTYNLSMERQSGGQSGTSSNVDASLGYTSPYAELGVGIGRSDGYNQANASISGSIAAWGGGVAFSPEQGDTAAVVEAKDAAGAPLGTIAGQRVDPWGHGLITSLTPFEENDIDISPDGLPLGINLKSTMQKIVPTDGAVVKVKFDTENLGQTTLLRVTRPNGEKLPFGTQVFDNTGKNVGMVAQAGQLLVNGLAKQGTLHATWGKEANQQCTLHYSLPTHIDPQATFTIVDSLCDNTASPQTATVNQPAAPSPTPTQPLNQSLTRSNG